MSKKIKEKRIVVLATTTAHAHGKECLGGAKIFYLQNSCEHVAVYFG